VNHLLAAAVSSDLYSEPPFLLSALQNSISLCRLYEFFTTLDPQRICWTPPPLGRSVIYGAQHILVPLTRHSDRRGISCATASPCQTTTPNKSRLGRIAREKWRSAITTTMRGRWTQDCCIQKNIALVGHQLAPWNVG